MENDLCAGCEKSCHEIRNEFEFNIESTVKFCSDHNLISKRFTCPKCSQNCNLDYKKCAFICNRTKTNRRTKKRERCGFYQSIFKDTFFSQSRLPLWKSLCFINLFCYKSSSREICQGELKISRKSFAEWANFCRDVCISLAFNSSEKLGGPGKIVEIDAAKIGKRKYNVGRVIGGQWIFGGIERESKKIFVVPVVNGNRDTLLACIKEWIHEGTTIISHNFVDSDSGVHTQNIERCWSDLKSWIPKYGRRKKYFLGYLARAYFFKMFPNQPERFHHFLLAAAKMYSSPSIFNFQLFIPYSYYVRDG